MSTEITEHIIAAAIEVHQHLGPAYHESIYQQALAYEMTLQNISFEQEKEIEVSYLFFINRQGHPCW